MPKDSLPSSLPHLGRRSFLGVVGGFGAVMAVEPFYFATPAEAGRKRKPARWSDRKTWGGKLPGPNQVAVISKPVLLDVNAKIGGVVIKPNGRLIFDPSKRITLRSAGNVEVRGRLVMRPSSPGKTHRLVFVDVDESRFVGGGMKVLPTDVGLWVVGRGVLDLVGAKKRAWTRAATSIATGAKTIRLKDDPAGWRVGDELAITPTVSPANEDHHVAYDYATVTAIHGRRVTLSKRTTFAHPTIAVGGGKTVSPEVLNLSRTVRVEGTSSGRSHVLIHSSRQQNLRHILLRHMGPRRLVDSKNTEGVPGRYGLHFHHVGHAAHGTNIKSVVVRDCGNHSFVGHESHGLSFRDCISHDTSDDAYWYDFAFDGTSYPKSDDILYENCVASLVQAATRTAVHGFLLGVGERNEARNCVAVGVRGNRSGDSTGFGWPESRSRLPGPWTFTDCITHNSQAHGIVVWQNNNSRHVIKQFTGYHNSGAGIRHGAYTNSYHYESSILYGNLQCAVEMVANSKQQPRILFADLLCDAAGLSDHAVVVSAHQAAAQAPAEFRRCMIRGHRKAGFGFVKRQPCSIPDSVDIVDCVVQGNEFWLDDATIQENSRIRVQDSNQAILLKRADQSGEFVPEWNARIERIDRFA